MSHEFQPGDPAIYRDFPVWIVRKENNPLMNSSGPCWRVLYNDMSGWNTPSVGHPGLVPNPNGKRMHFDERMIYVCDSVRVEAGDYQGCSGVVQEIIKDPWDDPDYFLTYAVDRYFVVKFDAVVKGVEYQFLRQIRLDRMKRIEL